MYTTLPLNLSLVFLPDNMCFVQRNSTASVMVWGTVGLYDVTVGELVVLDENVTAAAYIRTLEEHLLTSVQNIFGDRNHRFIFQHDNAPAHTARITQAWLEEQDFQTIQWPAHSPDLNLIENIWDDLGKAVVRDRPTNRADLIRCLHRRWNAITPQYVQRLFESMPRRVRAVIRSRGYPTRY